MPPFQLTNGRMFLTEMIDQALCGDPHPAAQDNRRPSGMYPHQASAEVVDPKSGLQVTIGGCTRQSWYDLRRVPPSEEPAGAKQRRIMKTGDLIATEFVYEQAKRAGIYVADEISMFDPDNKLSGRYDLMVRLPDGSLMVVDVKSISGWKEVPHCASGRNGFDYMEPRWKDLLQLMCYMQWYLQFGVLYGSLVYVSREMEQNEFCFEWVNLEKGAKRPHDDAYLRCYSRERAWELPWLTWGQIRRRYESLYSYLQSGEMPPRDFKLFYSNSDLVRMAEAGGSGNQLVDLNATETKTVLSKLQTAKKRKPDVDIDSLPPFVEKGSFQCNYCNWKTLCWSGMSVMGTDSLPVAQTKEEALLKKSIEQRKIPGIEKMGPPVEINI